MNVRPVRTYRAPSCVDADPSRMVSVDGTRWATCRNVKCQMGYGRFEVVRACTVKTRDASGKVVVLARNVSEARAAEMLA